jgi:hypothetical protein
VGDSDQDEVKGLARGNVQSVAGFFDPMNLRLEVSRNDFFQADSKDRQAADDKEAARGFRRRIRGN